ncbi:hypothetical protein [Nonomuraea insulae]|uniref:Uncharacterized protein n=1 Tax=Nonomuraea insulae TaxID=1616787 RepID=A0ABW1CFH1_9ACTN
MELADAIAFRQGPAAQYLPPLDQAVPELDAKGLEVKRLVEQELVQNPQLATDLAAKLQSGDRVAVSSAIVTLGELAHKSLNTVYGTDVVSRAIQDTKSRMSPSATTTGTGLGAVQVNTNMTINTNYTYAYAAIYGAVAVLIIIVLILPANVGNLPALSAEGNVAKLAHEQFVDQIATGLQAK